VNKGGMLKVRRQIGCGSAGRKLCPKNSCGSGFIAPQRYCTEEATLLPASSDGAPAGSRLLAMRSKVHIEQRHDLRKDSRACPAEGSPKPGTRTASASTWPMHSAMKS